MPIVGGNTHTHPDGLSFFDCARFVFVVRVQANTIETVVLFFPALWLFAVSFGDVYAAAVGVLYPLGRIIYANAYYKAADKRSLGFLIGFISHIILIIGGLIGMGHAALALYL